MRLSTKELWAHSHPHTGRPLITGMITYFSGSADGKNGNMINHTIVTTALRNSTPGMKFEAEMGREAAQDKGTEGPGR